MNLPKRKPNRLKHYDYSQSGSYFVTICLKDREPLLWAVGADRIRPGASPPLSACGELVRQSILAIPTCYPHVGVDGYVIMPNHVHMILTLFEESGRMRSAPTRGLSTIIGQTKRRVSRQVGCPFWQKSFHDHVIRNEQEYQNIVQYIATNPLTWETDCFFPKEIVDEIKGHRLKKRCPFCLF